VWTHQLEISEVAAADSVALEGSSVYVAGVTGVEGFVRKYDLDGNFMWADRFGTPGGGGYAWALAVFGLDVYVAGSTRGGTFPGEQSEGGDDAFVRKYDAAGTEIWTHQFGASGNDMARAAVADASSVYVAGLTDGSLPGQTSAGGEDAFLAAIDTVAPTVAITSPQDGAILQSTIVNVTGTASDDVAVGTVELSVDGSPWVFATGVASWSATLALGEGLNTITARATDTTGNVGMTTIAVTVKGEPTLLLGLIAGVGTLAVAIVAVVFLLKRRKRRGAHPPTEAPPPVR
jgi:hypothetical protein